MADVADRNQL